MFISKFYHKRQAHLVLNNFYKVLPNNLFTIASKEPFMLTTTRMLNAISGGLHIVHLQRTTCIFQGWKYFLCLNMHFVKWSVGRCPIRNSSDQMQVTYISQDACCSPKPSQFGMTTYHIYWSIQFQILNQRINLRCKNPSRVLLTHQDFQMMSSWY